MAISARRLDTVILHESTRTSYKQIYNLYFIIIVYRACFRRHHKRRYVRVVKETDSKSVGLCLRRFESCCRRINTFFSVICIFFFLLKESLLVFLFTSLICPPCTVCHSSARRRLNRVSDWAADEIAEPTRKINTFFFVKMCCFSNLHT